MFVQSFLCGDCSAFELLDFFCWNTISLCTLHFFMQLQNAAILLFYKSFVSFPFFSLVCVVFCPFPCTIFLLKLQCVSATKPTSCFWQFTEKKIVIAVVKSVVYFSIASSWLENIIKVFRFEIWMVSYEAVVFFAFIWISVFSVVKPLLYFGYLIRTPANWRQTIIGNVIANLNESLLNRMTCCWMRYIK